MYFKYRTEGENPEWLKAASTYSPDVTDMQRRDGYNYDAYLLEGDNKNVGFQSKYISYLEENKLFKEEYKILWSRFVNSKMQQAPAIHVSYDTDTLDFTKSRNTWTLIDVWGTWCSPCCKELPHLNEVANKYNSLSGSLIRIRTFSYFSTNLKEFMSKNSYTFPVAEITDEVTKPFGVRSYPTKLFVSPNNKFLVIPFNVNWEEYMRNYCNIE